MWGYSPQYEEEWGLAPPPWSYPVWGRPAPPPPRYLPGRYPVYSRRHQAWLPPGALQLYGPAPTHYYEEFRSNSALLPAPPELVWSRPARRTQSSRHPGRGYRDHHHSREAFLPAPAPAPSHTLHHQASFASR